MPLINAKNWRDGLFVRPSGANAVTNGLRIDSHLLGPKSSRFSFSVNRQHHILSSVIALLLTRGPAAIILRVTLIIIATLDFVFWWTFSHIGEELNEGIPLGASFNSASPITVVLRVVGVVTSVAQGLPRFIFSRALSSGRLSMYRAHPLATAAFNRTLDQVFRADLGDIPAVAKTSPIVGAPLVFGRNLRSGQCTETQSDQVFEFFAGRNNGRIRFRHWFSSEESKSRGRWAFTRFAASFCLV